jgi:hypothetical protein
MCGKNSTFSKPPFTLLHLLSETMCLKPPSHDELDVGASAPTNGHTTDSFPFNTPPQNKILSPHPVQIHQPLSGIFNISCPLFSGGVPCEQRDTHIQAHATQEGCLRDGTVCLCRWREERMMGKISNVKRNDIPRFPSTSLMFAKSTLAVKSHSPGRWNMYTILWFLNA